MPNNKPTILIIFGISGDLARRYLLPALEELKKKNMSPDKFALVGITRKRDPNFFQMDLANGAEYERLNEHLLNIEKSFGTSVHRLFYLSVPSDVYASVVEFIGKSSLIKNNKHKSQSNILLEKPFGSDLQSAEKLLTHIRKYFSDAQVHHVDHYMLKEGTQEMLTVRNSQPFKNSWNKDFIKSIEVIASEAIGIENRVSFYEKTGALRDFLQNHLLELTALTLMEIPDNPKDIPKAREKTLKNLSISCDLIKNECVKRAQYEGYRAEVFNPKSMTETFVSIKLESKDPRWTGVPITLTTGKALDKKSTEINVRFKNKKDAINLFSKNSNAYEKVLFNAINADYSFFASSGEMLESWRIVEPVLRVWKDSKDDILIYKKGSTVEEVKLALTSEESR